MLVIYADDVLLYKPTQSAVDYVLLQKDVDAVGWWSTIHYPKFNPAKCKAMVFSRKRSTTAPCDPLTLNGQALDLVDAWLVSYFVSFTLVQTAILCTNSTLQ